MNGWWLVMFVAGVAAGYGLGCLDSCRLLRQGLKAAEQSQKQADETVAFYHELHAALLKQVIASGVTKVVDKPHRGKR